MTSIRAKTSLRNYPILIEKGILGNAHFIIKSHIKKFNKIMLVTNETIYGIYKKEMMDLCQKLGSEYDILTLGDGEEYKSLDSAETAYSRLLDLNYHRNDIMIAFGGGVIGDTAGYIAATFHRGMKLVHIPTTIIAQVDSSIGGKVVVNYRGRKNIVGCFYQPHAIIVDPNLLKTLEEEQIINGLGEIIKYGLVFDKKILDWFYRVIDNGNYRIKDLVEYDGFEEIIMRCAKIKAKVVEKDEFDRGYRNLLNFGHTIGHSLESISGLKDISHGQAVGMGMIAALEISERLGFLNAGQKEEIKLFFRKLGLPYEIPNIDVNRVIEGLKYDKKFTSRKNRFVLLKKINRPFFLENVETDIILASLNNCINN